MILSFTFLGIKHDDHSLAFGILSAMLFIPGIYYGVQLYRLYNAKTDFERDEIIKEIPM